MTPLADNDGVEKPSLAACLDLAGTYSAGYTTFSPAAQELHRMLRDAKPKSGG